MRNNFENRNAMILLKRKCIAADRRLSMFPLGRSREIWVHHATAGCRHAGKSFLHISPISRQLKVITVPLGISESRIIEFGGGQKIGLWPQLGIRGNNWAGAAA